MKADPEFKAYVRSVILKIILVAVWFALLSFISDTSTYHIRGITPSTFGIAMMLTPWGMIQNLLLNSGSWLRPFYSSSTERFGLFDDPALRWSIGAFIVVTIVGVVLFFHPRLAKFKSGFKP